MVECHRLKRCPILVLALAAMAGVAPGASLSPAYDVTDLGTSFRFAKDASGDTKSVTSGDGTATYPFDKFPVTYGVSPVPGQVVPDGWYQTDRSYAAASNRYGSIGFTHHVSVQFGGWNYSNIPGSMPWENGDIAPVSPEQDFNTSGQVVGSHDGYAMVSGKDFGLQPLPNIPDLDRGLPGILDHLIPSTANLHLAAGLFIDDSGRIIAQTAAGEDFLLTPTPEPPTLALAGLVAAGLACRSWTRAKKASSR